MVADREEAGVSGAFGSHDLSDATASATASSSQISRSVESIWVSTQIHPSSGYLSNYYLSRQIYCCHRLSSEPRCWGLSNSS